MAQVDFVQEMRNCAELLYQNREQEAYEKINSCIGVLNQLLQSLAAEASEDAKATVLAIVNELVTSYQLKDNLALADFFFYVLPEVMRMTDAARV